MLPTTYAVCFLVVNIISNEATDFKSFNAIKTNDYPKSSCHKITHIKSKSRCLGKCEIIMDRIVMISHDESTNICMCCNDITGSVITSQNWKSYVPRTLSCAEGYATYNLMPYQICLKYFPVPASYSTAQANCQAEGADLIKIDSQEKYDIFKDYHVQIANSAVIQVWVQGKRDNLQWYFDDGTPIPDFCPIKYHGDPLQIHVRAQGYTSFECVDASNSDQYHYSCEYHRLLSFRN